MCGVGVVCSSYGLFQRPRVNTVVAGRSVEASGSSVVVMGGVWWAMCCLCGPLVTVGLRQMSCFKGRPIRWAAFGVRLGRSSRRAVCWLSVGLVTPPRDCESLYLFIVHTRCHTYSEQKGHARSQLGRQPAAAKHPLHYVQNCSRN